MEKRIIITFLIVAAIVALSIFFLYDLGGEEDGEDERREGSIDKTEEQETENQTQIPKTNIGAGAGGESGTGTSGGSGSGTDGEKPLPDDIDTRPCGFYFGEYQTCAGACSSGTCQQEGESCYCKI